MANNSQNVAVAAPKATGGAYHGPLGSLVPSDARSALDPELSAVGYVGEDGVSTSISTSTNDIIAWGGDKVRVIQTDHDFTVSLTMIETSAITAGIYYHPDNVAEIAASLTAGKQLSIKVNARELPRGVWVFELVDGDKIGRLILPEAQVTNRGDVPYTHGDAIVYPITLTCYPDENGNKAYIIWDDGQILSGGGD